MQMARIDGYNQPSTTRKKDAVFTWTNVYEEDKKPSEAVTDSKDHPGEGKRKYRNIIFGEEAMRISPKDPYTIHRPIRRGHFNVSPQYSAQQVLLFFSCLVYWWR